MCPFKIEKLIKLMIEKEKVVLHNTLKKWKSFKTWNAKEQIQSNAKGRKKKSCYYFDNSEKYGKALNCIVTLICNNWGSCKVCEGHFRLIL